MLILLSSSRLMDRNCGYEVPLSVCAKILCLMLHPQHEYARLYNTGCHRYGNIDKYKIPSDRSRLNPLLTLHLLSVRQHVPIIKEDISLFLREPVLSSE